MIERMRGLERARADRAELARADWLIWRAAAPIYSMRAMLQLVASVYAKMPSAQFDCSKMLFDLCGNVPWIYGFAVVRKGGRVTCATGAINSRVAAGRRASPAARAADDRYRSFQAIERPLRSRQGRCVSACGGRDTVASDAREGRRRRPLRRRGVRVLAARLDVGRTAALAEEARRAVEDLLITHADAADRALYAAKRCGCNAVVAHESMVLRAAS